jgi:hypothetical protein
MKNPVKAWQEASQKVLDTQSEWFKLWMGSAREETTEE